MRLWDIEGWLLNTSPVADFALHGASGLPRGTPTLDKLSPVPKRFEMKYLHILALLFFSSTVFAEDKQATVTVGSASELSLTVPKEATITQSGAMTKIETKNLWIYLWEIPDAKTVAGAVPNVGTIIKGEFINFALTETKDLNVAGHPAKHLFGKGAEADDGDTGTAEVVIFSDGQHVFAACVHGEDDAAAKESARFLTVLKSIKTP